MNNLFLIKRVSEVSVRLSRRLLTAAGLCQGAARVIDVGCDHGKLCAYLLANGVCGSAVAIDINSGPLSKAQRLFSELGLDGKATTILGDGLDSVELASGDTVVAAGIGPDIISDILSRKIPDIPGGVRFVLVPASHHERMRMWLLGNGFNLESESAVVEGGHAYTVMSAVYNGVRRTASDGFAAAGLIKPNNFDSAEYLAKVLERNKRVAGSACAEPKKNAALAAVKHIEELLTPVDTLASPKTISRFKR